MTLNNELKLMIYESSLNDESKTDLFNIIESTDDEELLCNVIDILEASKEEADVMIKRGKWFRQMETELAKDSADETTFDIIPKIKKRNDAVRSGKYGSQYEKMSPEEQRKRDIKKSIIDRDSMQMRNQKKKRGEKPYLSNNRSIVEVFTQSDLEREREKINKSREKNMKLQYKNTDKRHELYDRDVINKSSYDSKRAEAIDRAYNKAQNKLIEKRKQQDNKMHTLFTKQAIINDMKEKYKDDPEKREKLSKIREKHGHKLESVLEAFKEGILTESEVIEILE